MPGASSRLGRPRGLRAAPLVTFDAAQGVELPVRRRRAYIIPVMMRPNSEQDTRLAPSISRAKS